MSKVNVYKKKEEDSSKEVLHLLDHIAILRGYPKQFLMREGT